MTLERNTFDNDSLLIADNVHKRTVEYIDTHYLKNVDLALAGVRVYLTACDIIGGPVTEVVFPYAGAIARVTIEAREAEKSEPFEESDIDKEMQKELCEVIFDAMEEPIENNQATGWQNGILAVIGVRVMMLGIDKSPDIKKLCVRHNKKNYNINISTPDTSRRTQ